MPIHEIPLDVALSRVDVDGSYAQILVVPPSPASRHLDVYLWYRDALDVLPEIPQHVVPALAEQLRGYFSLQVPHQLIAMRQIHIYRKLDTLFRYFLQAIWAEALLIGNVF